MSFEKPQLHGISRKQALIDEVELRAINFFLFFRACFLRNDELRPTEPIPPNTESPHLMTGSFNVRDNRNVGRQSRIPFATRVLTRINYPRRNFRNTVSEE